MATFSAVSKFRAEDQYSRVMSKMTGSSQKFAAMSKASFKSVEARAVALKKRINGLAGSVKSLAAIGGVTGLLLIGAQAIKEYDTQMAGLRAITGVTGEQFESFEKKAATTAKQVGASTTEIAKGFEIVGSKLPQLLQSEEALAAVTKSAVQLRQAAGFTITAEDSYIAVTGAINQFSLEASQSHRVMNALAAAQQAGSATILDLNASIEKGAKAAKDAGVSLESYLAQAELLEPAGLRGAEAGTALRNIWLKIQNVKGLPKEAITKLQEAGVNMELLTDKTIPAGQRLAELQKLSKVSAGFMKVFGTENVIAAKTLIEHGAAVDQFANKITGTNKGVEQAAENTGTLGFKLTNLTNSYKNAITAQASNSVGLKIFGGLLDFVANNLDWVVGLIAGLASVLLPLIGIYKAVAGVTWLFNAAAAVSALLSGKGAIALKGNAAALGIYGAITKTIIALQWAWNAALAANPIGLIVVAVVAVIAIIVLLVKHWNTLKEKFTKAPTWVKVAMLPFIIATAPLLILVNVIRKVVDAWGGIKQAFTEGGFGAGIKKLGGVILSALIDPLVFMLKLIAKIPGAGKLVGPAIDAIEKFQAKVAQEPIEETGEPPKAINTQATQNGVQTQIERSEQRVSINVNDPKNRTTVDKGQGPVPVSVNSTTNNFGE